MAMTLRKVKLLAISSATSTCPNSKCILRLNWASSNTAILTARKEASYLIDDKTMKVRAALMKKILEKEAPDTKFHFVNGRTFNQLNKGNLVLKQLIQKDWQIPAEISPEIAAKIAERKAGEA